MVLDPYEEVRSLIYEGCLYNHVVIKEHDFFLKLRNPSNQDLDWSYEFSPTKMWKKEIALLGKSIHSINGQMVSKDQTFNLINYLSSLNIQTTNRLSMLVYRLMLQAKKAHSYLESYCYESESRNLWDLWLANQKFGFSPIDNQTKLSELQNSWVNWNLVEDERKKTRLQWDQALLITSSMNHKGAKDIGGKWEANDKREEDYREKVKENARSGRLDKENIKQLRNKLDTFDDLKEEMRKWVAGEEDDHDRIVREYKESMYQKIEENKSRAEQVRRNNEERLKDLSNLNSPSFRSNPVVALTDEEVKKMISIPKKYKYTNDHEEKFEHVKERYITAKQTSGHLKIDSEGELVDTKKKSEKQTLMDELKKRPTVLGGR